MSTAHGFAAGMTKRLVAMADRGPALAAREQHGARARGASAIATRAGRASVLLTPDKSVRGCDMPARTGPRLVPRRNLVRAGCITLEHARQRDGAHLDGVGLPLTAVPDARFHFDFVVAKSADAGRLEPQR